MSIVLEPIAHVVSSRSVAEDDDWDAQTTRIELVESLPPDTLKGLDGFSHLEVLYHFHQVAPDQVVLGARHPRGNPRWPAVGIFAQRARNRPNRLGVTVCRLVRVEGRTLQVSGLDAIDGTPVLDIKPVMREFLPRGEVLQPAWVEELMADYWQVRSERS